MGVIRLRLELQVTDLKKKTTSVERKKGGRSTDKEKWRRFNFFCPYILHLIQTTPRKSYQNSQPKSRFTTSRFPF